TAAIPVLQVTAGNGDHAGSPEAGADAYLPPPADPRALVAPVRAWLRVRRAERRERATRAELEALAQGLQNQKKWLEAVLDLLPVPLLFVEPPAGRVAFANKAAHALAGGEFPAELPAA